MNSLSRETGEPPMCECAERSNEYRSRSDPDWWSCMDCEGRVEPTIGWVRKQSGSRPCTPEEFEALFGDLPTDGEG